MGALSDITALHRSLVTRVLEGDGRASSALRRAAFDNAGLAAPVGAFVDKVALRARTVTDSDVAALRNAGLSEDQIYEIAVCAAIGQATRQYQAALAALSSAKRRA